MLSNLTYAADDFMLFLVEISYHWEMLYLILALVEKSLDSLRETEKVAREFGKNK